MLSLLEAIAGLAQALGAVVEVLASWRFFVGLGLGVAPALLAVWLFPEAHVWVSVPSLMAGLAGGVWWELGKERDCR